MQGEQIIECLKEHLIGEVVHGAFIHLAHLISLAESAEVGGYVRESDLLLVFFNHPGQNEDDEAFRFSQCPN